MKVLEPFTSIIVLVAVVAAVEPARILAFFPFAWKSIQFLYRPIIEEMAKRGHEVLFVTPFPYDHPPEGITQIVIPMYDMEEMMDMNIIEYGEKNVISNTIHKITYAKNLAEVHLGPKQVQDLIHSNEKFDAVMFEPFYGQEIFSAFVHKFNAVGIDIVSLGDFSWMNELAGLPDNPAYQKDFMSYMPSDMDFWQRLYNTYVTTALTLCNYYYLYRIQPLVDQYFNYTGWETRPPIEALARNKSLVLVNFDHLLGDPYPIPPHRKDIAGIHIKPNKPLPKDLQIFMDESNEGVIYMSFGSYITASMLGNELQHFFNVFKELPHKVLIKIGTPYPDQVPPNVKMAKWFPQQDILAHNNCVLFITHGGLLSMTEAMYHGVPIVGVPFFYDQTRNLISAEEKGLGRFLKIRNITRETVSWTVREVLTNKRYKEEAARRSKKFRDRRNTPLEEAVYWIEHSLKYPYSLTPKTASLSPIQLHMLDVKIFLVSVLLVMLSGIYILIRYLLRARSGQTEKRKMKLH